MKTKFWYIGVIIGLWFAGSAGSSIAMHGINSFPDLIAMIIMIVFAILFLGYGFKLRRLAKKGVENTKQRT